MSEAINKRNVSRQAASLRDSIDAMRPKCHVCGSPAQLDDGSGRYFCDEHYQRDVIGPMTPTHETHVWHPVSPPYEQAGAVDFINKQEQDGERWDGQS